LPERGDYCMAARGIVRTTVHTHGDGPVAVDGRLRARPGGRP
jgi:hypothetical protein